MNYYFTQVLQLGIILYSISLEYGWCNFVEKSIHDCGTWRRCWKGVTVGVLMLHTHILLLIFLRTVKLLTKLVKAYYCHDVVKGESGVREETLNLELGERGFNLTRFYLLPHCPFWGFASLAYIVQNYTYI